MFWIVNPLLEMPEALLLARKPSFEGGVIARAEVNPPDLTVLKAHFTNVEDAVGFHLGADIDPAVGDEGLPKTGFQTGKFFNSIMRIYEMKCVTRANQLFAIINADHTDPESKLVRVEYVVPLNATGKRERAAVATCNYDLRTTEKDRTLEKKLRRRTVVSPREKSNPFYRPPRQPADPTIVKSDGVRRAMYSGRLGTIS